MGSQLQNEANRRNAGHSYGPNTAEGKAASSKNSLKHGLLSRSVLLPDEDAEAFAQLGERLMAALNPVGELELVPAWTGSLGLSGGCDGWARLRRAFCRTAIMMLFKL